MMIYPCREAARLLSEARDRRLALGERIGLYVHTATCRACRAYARQIRVIDEVFALHARRVEPALPTGAGLDAAARERIRVRLRAARP